MVISFFSPKIARPEKFRASKSEISLMYPNLYYAFKDLFGVDWKFLHFFNSFGFFVALAFISAWYVLRKELMRKESRGLLQSKEETIVVGKPATPGELMLNFIVGFLFGYKFIGLFVSDSRLANNPDRKSVV